ncbi:uncharacterized protein [Pseudochaenichthys georgianus]|uniref:uncharacterized protein isoform X1 n=2 Tax=Pseudochaenichthys georgianus TaxID=52239 RepID=UPI00146A7CE3|nr:uncharacterized protein LOC117462991 [Pseudochaenichthys georgianus]
MTTRTAPEHRNDEEVSALLSIYSDAGMQQLLQQAVPNSKCFERCSQKLLEMTIDSGTLLWELAETADSVGCEVSNNDEGEAGQLAGLQTSGLSFPDRNSIRCSSPFPSTKRKRKRAQDTHDEKFFATIETMEDRRAMASKAMHEDQMMLLHKAQETEDRVIAMMERQDERDAVLAQHMEQQKAFQQGFLGVLSELVKSNRPSSLYYCFKY